MEQVHELHGIEGTGERCWNSKLCPSRRSYWRNKDRINDKRSRIRQEAMLETLRIPVDEPFADIAFAVLTLYRAEGSEAPIHAIASSVWQGSEQILDVAPIHCVGMVPSGVHGYIQKILAVLNDRYGIKKFAALQRLDPHHCPIAECFLRNRVSTF